MKSLKNISLALAATLTMVSCSKDDSIFNNDIQGGKHSNLSLKSENEEVFSVETVSYNCGKPACPGHSKKEHQCRDRDSSSGSGKWIQ